MGNIHPPTMHTSTTLDANKHTLVVTGVQLDQLLRWRHAILLQLSSCLRDVLHIADCIVALNFRCTGVLGLSQ